MIDKNKVMEALGTVKDPELNRSLTELNMIKAVDIDGGKVTVEVSLTIPGCPLKKKISEDVSGALAEIAGVEQVEVKMGTMTPEQRKDLAKRIYGKDHKADAASHGKEAPVAGDFADRVICVASGKGGVGKSTVTGNLAGALKRLGYKVGVLDADVYGFSIPRIFGVSGQPTTIDDHIVPITKDGIQIISIGFFVDENTPVIWRGPLLHKTINQFISDVLWDKLDFLLIDLPPGTGDVTISIAQALPKSEMLVITTPQPLASHTAGRVAKMAEQTKLSVLGVIENMAYYETNGRREYIFGKDGGKDLAKYLKVPFIGEIPIRIEIREAADSGQLIALSESKELSGYYLELASKVASTKP
ncbi:MAG: MRP family ATP-binding protein [candidate division Zixibacteria bacterium HGW-Zixibacteria-1]|nr:MAG: MRP family ATP-binding protein [candidate division Zixibacteria bacterium HGW-Zixibacteria-1]